MECSKFARQHANARFDLSTLQEAESLENRFEQLLSPAMRFFPARPQLNYFPTTQPFSARLTRTSSLAFFSAGGGSWKNEMEIVV
jgi:hypothetical protein